MRKTPTVLLTLFRTLLRYRHSLKSGPETRDPRPGTMRSETRDPGTLRPWDAETWTLGLWNWNPGLAILGHGTLTPGTLVMGPWGPGTSI